MPKEIVAHLMSIDVAEEFFKRCIEREAITGEERYKILEELVKERKAVELDKEAFKKQVKGKKALVVRRKKPVKVVLCPQCGYNTADCSCCQEDF